MLGRPGETGIERVQVHLQIVGNVAADDRALEEVDVVEVMGEPGGVEEVSGRGFPVGSRDRIDDVHGRARGAEMDAARGELEVESRIAPVKRDAAGGFGQHVLDQRPRETQPAVVAEDGAGRGHRLHPRFRRL